MRQLALMARGGLKLMFPLVVSFLGAAAAHSADATTSPPLRVEACAEPIGTLAITEPSRTTVQSLMRADLPKANALLDALIRQSNCFEISDAVITSQSIRQQSRSRAQAGPSADYALVHDVVITVTQSSSDLGVPRTGLRLLPKDVETAARLGSEIKGSNSTTRVQTSLVLVDLATGSTIAISEALPKSDKLNEAEFPGSRQPGDDVDLYFKSKTGTTIVNGFATNWGQIRKKIENVPKKSEVASLGTAAPPPRAEEAARAVARGLEKGDVLIPKIRGVKLFAKADSSAPIVSADSRDFVYLGQESGDYLKVASAKGEGWVEKVMVSPKKR